MDKTRNITSFTLQFDGDNSNYRTEQHYTLFVQKKKEEAAMNCSVIQYPNTMILLVSITKCCARNGKALDPSPSDQGRGNLVNS